MSDTYEDELDEGTTPAGAEDGEAVAEGAYVFDASHVKSHGVGISLKALQESDSTELKQAWSDFQEVVERHKTAVQAEDDLRNERNAMIRELKDVHGVSFAAMAEIIGVTHSNVLYTYERSLGKTAKQIREEQKLSSAAKAILRQGKESKPKRKMTAAEKQFRSQQRAALKAFLEEQQGTAEGEDADAISAALNEVAAEEALDAQAEET